MDLSVLNDKQKEAVLYNERPLLILAGAGSGKTRVLTYRVAYLMENGVMPWNILALTFTNKAANEMKTRIVDLVGERGNEVWASTFHSFCVRVLKRDCQKIGYSEGFSIYDESDSESVIKACLKEKNIVLEDFSPKEIKYKISEAKNGGIPPERYTLEYGEGFKENIVAEVYAKYTAKLKSLNAMDFDDLLVNTIELFEKDKETLKYYATKFKYINIDEYQDTNHVQYLLVKHLASEWGNVCVVGDDDQSIYGWRGATIRNIMEFEKDFPNVHVIRLEQNYRSTGNILSAANSVIANNLERKPKKLWTEKGNGEKIGIIRAQDERAEAKYICEVMSYLMDRQGLKHGSFAVLYRMNAQSRILEETLVRYGFPYKVYGGQKFYDRKEIKDIIAYLRLLVNPNDDVSLKRIINVPRRGIGNTSVEALEKAAALYGQSMFAMAMEVDGSDMKPTAKKNIIAFADDMRGLAAYSAILPIGEFVQKMIDKAGIKEYYSAIENTQEAEMRVENIDEFLGAVYDYEKNDEDATLAGLLDQIALVSDMDSLDGGGAVTLMTMHSAKGLEFPVVFIAGMEENLFPHVRSVFSEDGIEEERRLCYVGITRAKRQLFLSHTDVRNLFGRMQVNRPSRFLEEIPKDYTMPMGKARNTETGQSGTAQAESQIRKPSAKADIGELRISQKIEHKVFGVGTIINIKGSGKGRIIDVAFEGQGIKPLMVDYAPISVLN